jgi:predicted metal-binding membrane protein
VDDLCTAGGSGLPAVARFVGMWAVMMIPMMLPSLAPSLRACGSMSAAAFAGIGIFSRVDRGRARRPTRCIALPCMAR